VLNLLVVLQLVNAEEVMFIVVLQLTYIVQSRRAVYLCNNGTWFHDDFATIVCLDASSLFVDIIRFCFTIERHQTTAAVFGLKPTKRTGRPHETILFVWLNK